MKRGRLNFSNKARSRDGLVTTVTGAVCVAVCIVMIVLSFVTRGKLSDWVGVTGLCVFVAALVGTIVSAGCFGKEDLFMTLPRVGFGLNLAVTVLLLAFFIVGLVI